MTTETLHTEEQEILNYARNASDFMHKLSNAGGKLTDSYALTLLEYMDFFIGLVDDGRLNIEFQPVTAQDIQEKSLLH